MLAISRLRLYYSSAGIVGPRVEFMRHFCGARLRNQLGAVCQSTELWPNGRCKNHGGPSCGPRAIKGKLRPALRVNVQTQPKPVQAVDQAEVFERLRAYVQANPGSELTPRIMAVLSRQASA